MSSCFIIGVAGGSGSGKSTVTDHIIAAMGRDKVSVIIQDAYYKDLSHLPLEERKKTNFDHLDAFDWDLLKQHIVDLYNGKSIHMPTYDYVNYVRMDDTSLIHPSPVVVFEGIFALLDKDLRNCMALRIYVDTSSDIRLIRRIERDIVSRGRTIQSVIKQYLEFVRPMHKQFIEPTKQYSHIIIPHGANPAALQMITARIKAVLNNDALFEFNYFNEE